MTDKQIEELCKIAEEAARQHLFHKISKKRIEALNVCAEVEGSGPTRLAVEVDLKLAESSKDVNVQKLADDAVKEAFNKAEEYLRVKVCHSPK